MVCKAEIRASTDGIQSKISLQLECHQALIREVIMWSTGENGKNGKVVFVVYLSMHHRYHYNLPIVRALLVVDVHVAEFQEILSLLQPNSIFLIHSCVAY